MKTILSLALLICTATFYSCEKEKCVENRMAYATNVEAPSTGRTGDVVLIDVDFSVSNVCGQFGSFLESTDGNTRTIGISANYVGCGCHTLPPVRHVQYEFLTFEPGAYTLRFRKNQSEFIEVEIEIEQ